MSKIDQLLDGASDKFTAAEVLTNQEFFEDAVTRLFYGMLFCARALLLTAGKSPEDPDEIIAAFNSEFVNKGILDKEWGTLIKNVNSMAKKADFSPTFVVSEDKMKGILERAQVFMEQVEDIISEREE